MLVRSVPLSTSSLLFLALAACADVTDSTVHTSSKTATADRGDPTQNGKALTIDDLYDPKTKVDFSGHPSTKFTWIDADHWVEHKAAQATSKDAKSKDAKSKSSGDADKDEGWVAVFRNTLACPSHSKSQGQISMRPSKAASG